MKSRIYLIIAFLSLTLGLSAGVGHLLPKPQQISVESGSFSLSRAVQLVLPAFGENDPAIEAELNALLTENGGSVAGSSATIEVELVANVAGAEFQEEAYNLIVSDNLITIKATTLKGAYWAVQTLWQLSEEQNGQLPAVNITDWPAFRIRGYMHDVGRSYMQFETLKKHVEMLSRYKINVFHWHLTENQGWRLESQVYPQLNASSSYGRHHGQYYTIAQAKELVKFAAQHGVMVIPEIDMPGHSEAFRKAMGHVMLTEEGLTKMKAIMTEACETFEGAEWMHIGSDEVRAPDTQGATLSESYFISQMTAHIRSKGKKIVVWNPGHGYQESDVDMAHMWSSNGRPVGSLPAIDSRYYYINHFDQYADVAGAYNSNIANQEKGSHQWAGIIVGIWNDRLMPDDDAIVGQNAFYASMLAIAERAWMGGGGAYLPDKGTMIDPLDNNFKDWERRFLHHKANHLESEPIFYVKQTNVRWRITDPFPNGGNKIMNFPPENSLETSYNYNGKTYNTGQAVGAGIYLRHVWGEGTIPTYFPSPQANSTAYAYTWVYSPVAQTVGAQVEFQNYGRSEMDLAAPQGKWDYNESRVWVNDIEIAPPVWQNTHTNKSNEITLKNENYPARPLVEVQLQEGWNKVLIKLPNSGFSLNAVRLVKWMYTFVLVTPDGKEAVEGLIYSPDKNMNPSLDLLIMAIDRANSAKNNVSVGSEPGKYSASSIAAFQAKIDAAEAIRNNPELDDAAYSAAAEDLAGAMEDFKQSINMPAASKGSKTYWYSISASERDAGKSIAFQGNNAALKSENFVQGSDKFLWKVVENSDGTFTLVNKQSESHISPNSAYNTALKAQSGVPTSGGWTFTPLYHNHLFTVASGDVQLNQTLSVHNFQVFNWGGGNESSDAGCLFQFRLEKVDGADAFDLLQMVIDQAYDLYTNSAAGTEPGYYSPESKSALNDAMVVAGALLENSEATESELNAAKAALNAAIDQFNNSINLPLVSNNERTVWYTFTAVRENRSVKFQGTGNTLTGESYVEENEDYLWKLVELADGSYSLVNKKSGNYISTATPRLTALSGEQTANGWKFTPTGNKNYFIITSGTSQFNQGNAGTQYAINNWGSGTNTTDDGCQYIITTRLNIPTSVINVAVTLQGVSVVDGFLKYDGDVRELTVFNSMGQPLNPRAKLPQGVVIVRKGAATLKLIV